MSNVETSQGKDPPSWMTQTLQVGTLYRAKSMAADESFSQSWTNPIFPSSKPSIPSLTSQKLARANSTAIATGQPLPTTRPSRASISSDAPTLSRTRMSTLSSFFSAPAAAAGSSTPTIADLPTEVRGGGQHFTREDLKDAEFVAQVDRKFLLVKMRGRSDAEFEGTAAMETLVVVDQHAASERVRVERMFELLCGKVAKGEEVEVWTFGKGEEGDGVKEAKGAQPCAVVVSRAEAILAAERMDDFKRWGIGLEVPAFNNQTPTAEGDYVQLRLTSVPLVISDRLRVEPRLQQELVRSYLSQLAEHGGGSKSAREQVSEEKTWRSVVRQCPPVLLDLVKSKACRGAIMFNDGESPFASPSLLAR